MQELISHTNPISIILSLSIHKPILFLSSHPILSPAPHLFSVCLQPLFCLLPFLFPIIFLNHMSRLILSIPSPTPSQSHSIFILTSNPHSFSSPASFLFPTSLHSHPSSILISISNPIPFPSPPLSKSFTLTFFLTPFLYSVSFLYPMTYSTSSRLYSSIHPQIYLRFNPPSPVLLPAHCPHPPPFPIPCNFPHSQRGCTRPGRSGKHWGAAVLGAGGPGSLLAGELQPVGQDLLVGAKWE